MIEIRPGGRTFIPPPLAGIDEGQVRGRANPTPGPNTLQPEKEALFLCPENCAKSRKTPARYLTGPSFRSRVFYTRWEMQRRCSLEAPAPLGNLVIEPPHPRKGKPVARRGRKTM